MRREEIPRETLPDLLETRGEENGDKVFFYYGEEDEEYTYSEMDKITNQIHNSLIDLGINKNDIVSVLLRNPLITAFSEFGIWKCGAIYSPINFRFKGDLLAHQLKDTDPDLLILQSKYIPRINEIKDILENLNLENIVIYEPKENQHDYSAEEGEYELDVSIEEIPFKELRKGSKKSPKIEKNFKDTANIVYTSGTTGPPKGVVHSFNWLYWYTYTRALITNEEDVIYTDLPFYHVAAAFYDMCGALTVGGEVAVWDKFKSSEFWNRVDKRGASTCIWLDIIPPVLMNRPEKEDDQRNTLNKVYMQPFPEYHNKAAKRFGIDIVYVGYGQTEGSSPLCGVIEEVSPQQGTPEELWKGPSREEIFQVVKEEGFALKRLDQKVKERFLGKPRRSHEVAILDENDKEVSSGEIGELCIRPAKPGAIYTRYLGSPEKTLETNRNLWLHTGDAVKKDEEGNYYFVDRMDFMIRKLGENISTNQLEDAINDHPKVRNCAALPAKAEFGEEDEILVCVVASGELSEDELKEHMESRLPEFMLPKYIEFMEELPLSKTMKVEKKTLNDRLSGKYPLKDLG